MDMEVRVTSFVCSRNCDSHPCALAMYTVSIGREMVDFLRHALEYHVARELRAAATASAAAASASDPTTTTYPTSTTTTTSTMRRLALENAFLLADIHAQAVGIHSSGATAAVCLLQVRIYNYYSR
jgi:glucokinase